MKPLYHKYKKSIVYPSGPLCYPTMACIKESTKLVYVVNWHFHDALTDTRSAATTKPSWPLIRELPNKVLYDPTPQVASKNRTDQS